MNYNRSPAVAPAIILAVYYAARWLGLLPPRLLPLLDPVMGVAVFAAAAGLAAAGLAVEAATGLAVNPSVAAGGLFWQAVLVLPRLLGEAAAAASAAATGPLGAPLAVAIYLAPRVSMREVAGLAAGLSGPGLIASTVLPYGLLGITVYTVSARMGASGPQPSAFSSLPCPTCPRCSHPWGPRPMGS